MFNPKKPLFTLRNILLLTSAVLVFYILIWGWVYIDGRNTTKKAKQDAAPVEIKGTKEEQAALKAQLYLVNSITLTGTTERIFLSYLQRKFNLPSTLGIEGPPIDLHEDPQTYPSEIHYLARVAYPNRIVNQSPKYELDDGIKVTNIFSTHCDHLALPANFWPIMERNSKGGGYYATHVVLAFALLKTNNCSLAPNADDMMSQATAELIRLADNPTTSADLRYEAIAFLLLSERHDLVKSQWIDQIIKEQREDGGWSLEVGGKKNDSHTTLLAFWSLLEYTRPHTPDEPLIRRPTL